MKKIFLIGLSVLMLLPFLLNCVYAEETVSKTLILEENWRITSDLDLEVPINTTLTIEGNGYYIYEMGGKLTNTGKGKVIFEDTILYPLANDADAENIYVNDTWGADESNRLLLERKNIHSDKVLEYGYNVIKDVTGYKYEISMTSTENVKGTYIVALYDDYNRLVGVGTSAMDTENTSYQIPTTIIPTTETPTKYKIMFWNGLDSLKPLCKAVKGIVVAETE